MTLPLGLLHAGASPRDSCHPSIPPGCGLGHTFTSLCFSITFLGAFAIVRRRCRALHGWETADLDGEVLFPKRRGLVVGFTAGFAVVELTADSPIPSPAVFGLNTGLLNPQGSRALSIAAPELCLLLVALRQHLQMMFRISWSWCFHMLRAHLRKAPSVSIITLLSLQSKGNSFFQ